MNKYLKRMSNQRFARLLFVLILIFGANAPLYFAPSAYAAFTQFYVRLDRMSTGAALSGTVCAETATSGTEAKVLVTFPSDFTVSTTNTDWTVNTTAIPTGSTAWPTIAAPGGGDITSQTVTFGSGNLATSTLYCFNFVGANSTTGAAGSDKTGTVVTKTSGDVNIDSGSYATAIVSSNADQIAITASVPPTFSFSLGANSVALGTLSTSSVTSGTGVTVSTATNAANGYQVWVKGRSGTGMDDTKDAGYSYLYSPSTDGFVGRVASATVNGTPESLAAAPGYILDANLTTDNASGDGTLSIAGEYNGADTSSGGTISSTYTAVAASTGTTAGDVVTLIVRAKISAIQEAALDYADTLTVVGSGRF
jgi:hypothetical protein